MYRSRDHGHLFFFDRAENAYVDAANPGIHSEEFRSQFRKLKVVPSDVDGDNIPEIKIMDDTNPHLDPTKCGTVLSNFKAHKVKVEVGSHSGQGTRKRKSSQGQKTLRAEA